MTIHNVLDKIGTASNNAWYGGQTSFSFVSDAGKIDICGHVYEPSYEDFSATVRVCENGELLFDEDDGRVCTGTFADSFKQMLKYLTEKYKNASFEEANV